MAGRDKSSRDGRSDEDRLRDLAARERARDEGKRPPPSFGPSTRAGRERAAASGREIPTPRASVPAAHDAAFDFDFARPSTRAATPAAAQERGLAGEAPAAEAGAADAAGHHDVTIATVDVPPAPAPDPAPVERAPRTEPQGPPIGDGPQFAPLRSSRRSKADRDRTSRAPRDRSKRRAGAAASAAGKASAASNSGPLNFARRHRIAVAVVAASVLVLVAVAAFASGGDDDAVKPKRAAVAKKAPSPYGTPTPTPLPPETRIVAYTGAPQAEELGILGTMPFERAAERLERQSVPYDRPARPVLPAFILIATIANADPGPADKYRTRQSGKVIARYLRAARRHDAALILDVQPGTSNFVDEVKPLEKWLKEPDVHLALDPEWRMRPGVQPGSEIGWVSAGEITATLNRVARIVRANDLPPKLAIVHRFTDGMIKDLASVDVPKEVVGVISIDGVGTRTQKIQTYDRIAPTLPKPWLPAFKVFYVEDKAAGGILSGKQVMAIHPRPHVVLYE